MVFFIDCAFRSSGALDLPSQGTKVYAIRQLMWILYLTARITGHTIKVEGLEGWDLCADDLRVYLRAWA